MQPSIFALPGEQASADFHDDTFLHLARADYEEFVSDGDEKKTTFKEFLGKRFPGFGDILNVTMPIAVIPYGGYATKKAYITRQMIFDRGCTRWRSIAGGERVQPVRECRRMRRAS